ncbi:MAG: hypothetical protein NXH75_09505 [Halobacteriovoraceae bacterium]|nr:hypothetical protein [Halobacteriovoraceae bacterium]
MLKKYLILTILLCQFVKASAASDIPFVLKSLPEDGNYLIKIDPQKDEIFVYVNDGEPFERFFSVRREPGQFNTYSLSPKGHKKLRIVKTKKVIQIKKVKHKVFQLYRMGERDSIQLIAMDEKQVDLKKGFEKEEFKGLPLSESQNLIKEKCETSFKIIVDKNTSHRNFLRGIAKVCELDPLYKEAIGKIAELKITQRDSDIPKFSLSDKGKVLKIESSRDLFNSYNAIYIWLKDNL